MSEERARIGPTPDQGCDERPSDDPMRPLAARPERADEGGGPGSGATASLEAS